MSTSYEAIVAWQSPPDYNSEFVQQQERMSRISLDKDETDIYLPDHTQSMRKACHYCIQIFHRLEVTAANVAVSTKNPTFILEDQYVEVDKIRRLSKQHRFRREEAHRNFWSFPASPLTALNLDSIPDNSASSDTHMYDTKQTWSPITIENMQVQFFQKENVKESTSLPILCPEQVCHFQTYFQNLNIPCLIEGLDQTSHFDTVNRNWRRIKGDGEGEGDRNFAANLPSNEGLSKVNRQWFQDSLGDDFLVTLRYNPNNNENGLDEDGRALECETREVSLKEWLDLLELPHQGNNGNDSRSRHDEDGNSTPILYYLKDWHLQQRYPCSSSALPNEFSPDRCSLYTCPEFFRHDLLNSFLTRFTNGDYRFCYWGPTGSFTARHSDVLHSFSWSYNVVGAKEWTFYCDADSNDQNEIKTFTIRQETGQTIFVPAKWQHRVVNLEETISINHNWITSSNLDLVWDCLEVEISAIQKELQGWNVSDCDEVSDEDGLDHNMEACENMLRGCIGLDVTSFVLMTLVRILEALVELLDDESRIKATEQQQERLLFDVIRLTSVLRNVIETKDDALQLRRRLKAILQSDHLTQYLESMIHQVINWVQ